MLILILIDMCRSPLQIVNPSRYIDPELSQPLYISVPCGHCSECQSQQRNEWLLRLYYHQLQEFSSGCWCLFDTLTYRNSDLPRLSRFVSDLPKNLDFPCFSSKDIQDFLKRLRSKIGYNKMSYFIVAEYGADQHYTHRPHYHALFFVDGSVDPLVFSRLVATCWQHGRTDGVPFRPASYVNGNVFRSPSSKISNYVIKYVTKSDRYNSLVRDRLDKLRALDFDQFALAKSCVRQFHLQSLGFGYNFIAKLYSVDQLASMRSLPVVTSNGIKHVFFPLSLQRKFFYRFQKIGKHVRWFPLSQFVDFKLTFLNDKVSQLMHNFTAFCSLSDSYKCADYLLYHRYRPCSFLSSVDCVRHQYNVDDTGYRNYASKDRPFNNKVFTNIDIGSNVDGYRSGFTFKHVPLGKDDDHLSLLSDLDKLYYVDPYFERIIANYNASRVSDPALDVSKVVDRVKNLFKCYSNV